MLELLGESPEAYDLFVEALALRDALERETDAGPRAGLHAIPGESAEGDAADPVGPSVTPLWSRRWVPVAAAAALVGVVAVGVLRTRQGFDAGVGNLDAVRLAEGLPADWDAQRWTVLRGSTEQRLTAEALAFRMGVRSVDLDVALATDQLETARYVAAELESLAGEAEMGPPLVLRYRAVSEALTVGVQSAEPEVDEARGDLTTFLDADRVRLGRWAELGRIAAMTGDRAYLDELDRAPFSGKVSSLPSEDRRTLGTLETSLGEGTDASMGDVASLFEDLIASLGG